MLMSKLDNLGIEVSRLGFGCMRFPMDEKGEIDEEQSRKMLEYAYTNGVNYYDTAYVYHNSKSEGFMSSVLRQYPRESYYLADKFPIWLSDGTQQTAEALFKEQLDRCQVDYFDFYLVHALNAERRQELEQAEIYKLMQEWRAAGKIKYAGFSYHGDLEAFKSLLNDYKWDFVQIQVNYIDYGLNEGKELYDMLTEKGIPCVVMEPVRGGFLANPPEKAMEEIKAFGDGKTTPASWALRWCMDKDNMKIILSGMSSLDQVKENVELFSDPTKKTLNSEEQTLIQRIYESIISVKTVPCTGCGYCMDCSFGVDIPKVFDVFNQYKLFDNTYRAIEEYNYLKKGEHDATACTECGACAPMCPQNIKIPETLREVHSVLDSLKV